MFDFGGIESEFEIYFAAFYADCEHEVMPITDGFRISLVYNVVYTGIGNAPSLSVIDTPVQNLQNTINKWSNSSGKKSL